MEDLHWVEQVLISSWAAPDAAPPGPGETGGDGSTPWYHDYTGGETGAEATTAAAAAHNGWQIAQAPAGAFNAGAWYYYNEAKGITQWDRPVDYDMPERSPAAAAAATTGGSGSGSGSGGGASSAGASDDPADAARAKALEDDKRRMAKWYGGSHDELQEATQAVERCSQLLAVRGDDAGALSAVVTGCGVAPSRLMAARTGRGRTLLVEAASKGLATCVALIVDAWGADIDGYSSEDQGTALHHACWGGFTSTVQALLDRAADTSLLNKWAETPAAAARNAGREVSEWGLEWERRPD
jgi:hypothetical protein